MKNKFVGGVYHTPLTILEKFDDVGIHVPEEDCYFPLEIRNLPEGTDLQHWNAKHVPLRVSIASNVPGFVKPLLIINKKKVEEMIQKKLE